MNINLTSIIKIIDKLTLNYTIQTQSQTNIISKLETQSQVNQNEDFKAGMVQPERYRDVPAGIWPEFPEQARIKSETKTIPFCLSFLMEWNVLAFLAGTE